MIRHDDNNMSELTKPFVYKSCVCVTTGDLYGRAVGEAYIFAEGHDNYLTRIGSTTSRTLLPDNTRLLVVYSDELGFAIKLSNGFVTDTHWRCTGTYHVDWYKLDYNDDDWQPAKRLTWPWSSSWLNGREYAFYPAELISAETTDALYCRGWSSRYYTSDLVLNYIEHGEKYVDINQKLTSRPQ